MAKAARRPTLRLRDPLDVFEFMDRMEGVAREGQTMAGIIRDCRFYLDEYERLLGDKADRLIPEGKRLPPLRASAD